MRRIAAASICVYIVAVSLEVIPLAAQSKPVLRLAPVPEARRSQDQQEIAEEFAALGMTNAVATYLHHPVLARRLLPHLRYVRAESSLPAQHRAMLGLRTAWLARSEYLWAHWEAMARAGGITDEFIRRVAVGPESLEWDVFDAALLRAVDELHVDTFVSEATWQVLATRYAARQLVDAMDTVGVLTMHGGALNSLGVQIEDGVAHRLPANVPYTVSATRTNVRLQGREPRIQAEGPPDRANVGRTFGRLIPPTRGDVYGHINDNSAITLSPIQRQLVLVRIAVLCRAEYVFAAHSRAGRRYGMTDADVARIIAGPDSPGDDEIETALLRATDELHRDYFISDDTWTTLDTALAPPQLLDMMIAIGAYRSTTMPNNSAGVQLDASMADFRFPVELR